MCSQSSLFPVGSRLKICDLERNSLTNIQLHPMPPTAVLTSAAQSDMLVQAPFSHSLVTVGVRGCVCGRQIQRVTQRKSVCWGKCVSSWVGIMLMGDIHFQLCVCVWTCLGAICGVSQCLNEYPCLGHPFTTGDSGMMRDSQGPQDPRIQRPLTHLPPGVCVREKHQHLYVPSIPVWCVFVCGHVHVLSTGCNNNQHQRETLGTFFVRDCPDFLDPYYYTDRKKVWKKERKNKQKK